jgi:hypothetical protein
MDRFARNYLIGMVAIVVVAALWVFLSRDPRLGELNDLLAADTELADYPYAFRVLSFENGVATLSSPRSAEVPVMQFLRTAFPELRNTAVDDPAMMSAQDGLVAKQSRAAKLIKSQPDVGAVAWQLDEDWYRQNGVVLNLGR